MKLYIENGNVMFDYSDVDTNSLNAKHNAYRQFLRDTTCKWEPAGNKVVRTVYEPYGKWATEYGEAKHYENVLKNCYYKATYSGHIEISKDIEELLVKAAKRCQELYEIEVAKEEQRKALDKWDSLCKYGCGNCQNKKRCGDDYLCDSTGAILQEKNIPQYFGGTYQMFNYQAMPDDNCPFNVNKSKEERYEHL